MAKGCGVRLLLGVCLLTICNGSPTGKNEVGATVENSSKMASSPNIVDTLKALVRKALSSVPTSVTRKMMEIPMSTSCTTGLIKVMRGLSDLEPWAVRLIDASAKIPNGMLMGTGAESGAYDECIGTVVHDDQGNERIRGQYCNMFLKPGNDSSLFDFLLPEISKIHRRAYIGLNMQHDGLLPGFRFGICSTTDCDEADLQALMSALLGDGLQINVRECVTSLDPPLSPVQIGMLAFHGLIGLLVILGSSVDLYLSSRKECQGRGTGTTLLCAFSLPANLSLLLSRDKDKTSDANTLRFLHGMRAISMFWIVMSHATFDYSFMNSASSNALHYLDRLDACILTAAYAAVDTFFYLSGFLLTYNLLNRKLQGVPRVKLALLGIVQRIVRVVVPVFFVAGSFYLVPLIAKGPTSGSLYQRFYADMRDNWWAILLQIHNFFPDIIYGVFVHLWYIAADFQLFLVALLVIQLRQRTRVTIVAFASLSLACCSFSAWQMHDSRYTPVVMGVYTSITDYTKMLTGVYMLPTFHGACYFMGCIMAFVLREFKPSSISRLTRAILWVVGMSCCLTTIFVRYDFNRGEHSTEEWVKITLAFWDRIIWATFLAALTFLCANGSGDIPCEEANIINVGEERAQLKFEEGAVQKFLAWRAFVPLSRLSFGIYLVHIPFYFVSSNVRKELMYWSIYNVVTVAFTAYIWSSLIACIIFFVCEAPTGRISKRLLVPKRLFSEHEESTVAECNEECYNVSKLASKPVDTN